MKKLYTLLFLVFVTLLAACGGGTVEEDSVQEPATVSASFVPEQVIKGTGYGDSTQAGHETGGVNSFTVAQGIFDDRAMLYSIHEEGDGGSTTEHLLYGTWRLHTIPFEKTIAASDAHFVTFRFGINDVLYYDDLQFKANLRRLVEIAEAAGKWVILETPSPIIGGRLTRVLKNVDRIRELAQEMPSTYLCDHWEYGIINGYELSDTVHPTARDYRIRQGWQTSKCINRAAMLRMGGS